MGCYSRTLKGRNYITLLAELSKAGWTLHAKTRGLDFSPQATECQQTFLSRGDTVLLKKLSGQSMGGVECGNREDDSRKTGVEVDRMS